MENKPMLPQVLAALEDEIERAKHQMNSCPSEQRTSWKKYIEDLETKHADIQILGLFEDEEEDASILEQHASDDRERSET